MKLKPYLEYKDSGVEWLDDIPTEWSVKPLKFIADLRLSNIDKHTVEGEPPVLLCNYVDVYKNERIGSHIEFMVATASEEQVKRLSLAVGDVIITKDSEDPRDIGIPAYVAEIRTDLVCGYHLALIRSYENTSGEFLYYFLKSIYAAASFENEACGITRYAIGKYSIGNLDISIPSLADQSNIATFLDRETSKLDTLISKQEHLIELLQEKRQAIISHAVTKGLNPDAKMQDSGVEWLGMVPELWDIQPLKYNTYAKGRIGWQNLRSEEFIEEGPFLITGMHFKSGSIDWESCYHISQERYEMAPEIQLKLDDVLVTKDGTIGKLAYIDYLPGPSTLNSHLLVLRPLNNVYIPKFLLYVLSSDIFEIFIKLNQSGTTFYGITQEAILNFPLVLPKLEQQTRIITFLEKEVSKLDSLINKAKRSIDLAKEHRTALISAAVTGKIDVRDAT